jgi:hypothetical protein
MAPGIFLSACLTSSTPAQHKLFRKGVECYNIKKLKMLAIKSLFLFVSLRWLIMDILISLGHKVGISYQGLKLSV